MTCLSDKFIQGQLFSTNKSDAVCNNSSSHQRVTAGHQRCLWWMIGYERYLTDTSPKSLITAYQRSWVNVPTTAWVRAHGSHRARSHLSIVSLPDWMNTRESINARGWRSWQRVTKGLLAIWSFVTGTIRWSRTPGDSIWIFPFFSGQPVTFSRPFSLLADGEKGSQQVRASNTFLPHI